MRWRAACVDQTGHGHDDHRPQGGRGQVLEQRGQEQQGQDHHQGRGDGGELGAGPGPAVDGRLGQPPAGREGLEPAAGQVGRAQGAQLLVGVDLGLVPGGEGAGGRDRLHERHQGHARRRASSWPTRSGSGAARWGRPGGIPPTRADAPVGQAGGGGEQDPKGHHQQRPGSDGGPQRRSPSSRAMLTSARAKVGQLISPRLARAELGEEAVALLGDAEDLAEPADGGQQPGAGPAPPAHRAVLSPPALVGPAAAGGHHPRGVNAAPVHPWRVMTGRRVWCRLVPAR